MKILVSNPDYERAYSAWCEAESVYNSAVAAARAGANNWYAVNMASHARNDAKNKLNTIPQYIEVEVNGLGFD